MAGLMNNKQSQHGQRKLAADQLDTPHVVFFVLAAVAPLTGMVVVTALGIALGNGGGMPVSFIAVAAIMLFFACGYAQMAKRFVNAGGFYSYTVRSLGNKVGLAAGIIALLGYNGFDIGGFGTVGFYFQNIIGDLTGFKMSWMVWSVIAALAVFIITREGAAISSKVLGVSLALEMLVLLVLDFTILFKHGFSWRAFDPHVFTKGSLGLGLLFAGNGYIGFEATSLYSEEAKDPRRTVPRATYWAISIIGVFAAFTTWAFVSALGVDQAQSKGLAHLDAGDLIFSIANEYLGKPYTALMEVLLLLSLFAAQLALHNSATRYIYAMGRSGVLPRVLGNTRDSNGAPANASLFQVIVSMIFVFAFFLSGLPPMLSIVPAMTGFGTLCIIVLQFIASIAIIVYFRKVKDRDYLRTLAFPVIGTIGLGVISALAITNFSTMAGSDSKVIALLPWLLPIGAVAGYAYAAWLQRKKPAVYAAISLEPEEL